MLIVFLQTNNNFVKYQTQPKCGLAHKSHLVIIVLFVIQCLKLFMPIFNIFAVGRTFGKDYECFFVTSSATMPTVNTGFLIDGLFTSFLIISTSIDI